ncbi:MAG: beta-galactosidase [Calditrichaeota bacterium]|nr:MAG: beta-galactosidase [Calditrichota bacterium]
MLNKQLLLALLVLLVQSAFAQTNEKLVFDLSGPMWRAEGTLPGRGVELEFHKHLPDNFRTSVPGDVFTDLWRMGRIEDVNVGTNGQKAKWVNEYEWWYFRQFDVPKNMEGKQIRVLFEGVDYACDVYLNGTFLGSHAGMFSHFSFDISKLVKLTSKGESRDNNYLAVRLAPAPRNVSHVNGKKYRWHGDYNQNVVPTGIWQPIKLVATGITRIADVYTRPELRENGAAVVHVEVELINDSKSKQKVSIDVNLAGKNFKSKSYSAKIDKAVKPGSTILKTSIEVADPKLWWPWDLGDQNLYNADVLVTAADGQFQDAETVTFGIREVKMAMNPGWTKEEVEWPWTVMINGKRHFVRSGTWGGPPDMFTGRTTEHTYRELIRLAKEANINNLRIFTWHPPEIPLFYQLCNEAGITVWQDIVPMNNPILRNDSLKQAAFAEAVAILKQRRNHPCNIIIEGSEETLYLPSQSQRKYQWDFVVELGDTLKKYTDLHYIPTSPLSSNHAQFLGLKKHESAHPHGVHYGVGRFFMEDYYPKQNYAAIPELAVTSCPDVESIKKFIPEDELWPPGPSWGYRWADLDVLQAHNFEVFGEDFTDKSLEEFVEATQIAQGTYFQYALEHYRTRKPKMSAICFCHFILNSPDFKWATVDYYLQPKESHYFIQKAYQPLLITLQYEKRRWLPGEEFKGKIWVVNDFMKDFKSCKAQIKILDTNKKVIKKETIKLGDIAKDSSKEFADLNFKAPGKRGDKFYVEITMIDKSGVKVSANDYMLLVDDQQAALETYKKYGVASRERMKKYGRNTNRYFPGLFDNTKSTKVEWIKIK